MSKTAVITGAGSGVGLSVALALARENWQVGLVGRREALLNEALLKVGSDSKNLLVCPCNVGDMNAVGQMAKRVLAAFGDVEVLVNAAGTNAPRRALQELSQDDYHRILNTNLNGAYYCIQAFLPQMRSRRSGTIINIVSEAGKLGSAKAGAAYVVSKFGLAGLSQAVNAEERMNGIRASSIFPGDIDTPLLEKRPVLPDTQARAKMLRVEDVADCALFVIHLPPRAVVEEIVIKPTTT